MSSDYDIEMSLNDTLELDAIIEKSTRVTNLIGEAQHSSGSTHSLEGIQTHTGVFNPPKSGDFTINVNGQTLSIKVTNPKTTPSYNVDHRFLAKEFSDPWSPESGTVNMSVNGLDSKTFSNGETAIYGSSSDYGVADITDYASQDQWGIAFTVQYSNISSDFSCFFGHNDNGNNFTIETTDGEIGVRLRDNSNSLSKETTSSYDDGNPHAVIINKSGNTSSDIGIYVDDMTTDISSKDRDEGFDPDNYSNQYSEHFFARTKNGSVTGQISMYSGIFEFRSSIYSESERKEFINYRPEV